MKFTYDLQQAIQAAKAILPHIDKDDVTPALHTAKLTETTWIATDRYTVAKYDFKQTDTKQSEQAILLERAGIEWLTKIVLNKLRNKNTATQGNENALRYQLEISLQETTGDATLAITYDGNTERTQAFSHHTGNYPAVERLIETWQPTTENYPILLTPEHLEKVSTYLKREHKHMPLEIQLGEPLSTGHTPPVKIKADKLTVLIQPNKKL